MIAIGCQLCSQLLRNASVRTQVIFCKPRTVLEVVLAFWTSRDYMLLQHVLMRSKLYRRAGLEHASLPAERDATYTITPPALLFRTQYKHQECAEFTFPYSAGFGPECLMEMNTVQH